MNPENAQKSMTEPVGSHISLSQINILRCQQKELEHKGGQRLVHDTCIDAVQLVKRHKATLSSEEIKPVSLSTV